jgi:hypothetical protein
MARSAGAGQTECPIGQIGQPCGSAGSVCIDATCCDDPNGCAYDAGPLSGGGSSGAGSSGSGGTTGTGVSRACAVCEFLGETYCSPADLGKACPDDAGFCNESGGGGGPATSLDGGTTDVGFAFTVCGGPDESGDDGGTGFGSSSSGSSSGSGGGNGNGGGSSSGSSSSSSGSSGGTGSSGAGSASDGGADGKTVTAGCGVAPTAPHGDPWSVGACVGLGLAAIARRRRPSAC